VRAVWYERTGPAAEVLTYGEMPTPVAGPGEVRICIALRSLVLFALPPPLLAAAQADITKWLAAGTRIHNIAGQYALSDTAQAHLAVEKGDKLGTVIVDCAQ
jgi:NADPH:quinone reductase-like Zn-dependent oxidoreductase